MNYCNYCDAELIPKINFGNRPIVNGLSSSTAKEDKKYSIEMAVCEICGLHQVLHSISQAEFYTDYMTPSNWKSEPHLSELVNQIQDLALPENSIIDIGCNDGKFLLALRDKGFKRLFGIEPTMNTASVAIEAGFNVSNRYLDLELAHELVRENGVFDVVVTRQVLEHITDIKTFLMSARTLLGSNGFLVIEVPDSEINFKQSDYGIWEEHVNYFTKATLSRILKEMGWEVSKWYRSVFSGWCQTFIAKPVKFPGKEDTKVTRTSVSTEIREFDEWVSLYPAFKANLHNRIDALVGKEGRIALFGVGSRSISSLYSLDLVERISFAFDDNIEKIGKYIPGTGIQIKPSSVIGVSAIDIMFLGVNSENEDKVMAKLGQSKIPIYSILPPSDILLWEGLSNSLTR